MTDTTKEDVASSFGADEAGAATRWIAELNASEKYWAPYWKRCEKILDRYEDDRTRTASAARRRFSVLWSIIQTLQPTCYAKVPSAVVLRKNEDPDPVARMAAEALERSINYSLEAYDFDQVLKSVRDEFLLFAKGQTWTRYVPTFEEALQSEAVEGAVEGAKAKPTASAEPEQPAERLRYEEAVCDYVAYDDWGTNAARNWVEVRFVWRKVYMGRVALKKRFTRKLKGRDVTIGAMVPLDWKAEGSTEANKEQFGKAVIYEVWDKETRKAYWISKSFRYAVLDERDDPLGLADFFPCPKPALGTTSPRKIIPIPDYTQYQDQAEEVDDLSARIAVLTKAVRMVGMYASDEKVNLTQVFKAGAENEMIPVDSWGRWMEKGGLKGLIEWVPVEMVINVLKALYDARDRALAVIYEITGMPDIMRGDTDPDETAAAQGLKSSWGSSRVRDKQNEMARFCRDEMRLKGEVIAKKFSIETIKQMSGLQMLTRAEKQAIEAALAQHQQMIAAQQPPMPGAPPQQPPPPPPIPKEQLDLLGQPTWEDVDELLKSDGLRAFRIDIEADSTVEPDLMNDKRDATEFATSIGGIIGAAMPAVQAAPPLGKLVGATVKYVARRFKAGRELEGVIDQVMSEIAGQPAAPPPGQEPKQGGKSPEELALEQEKNAIAREKVGVERENAQADAATNAASVQAEMARTAADERIANLEATVRRMEAMLSARTDMATAQPPVGAVQ